MPSPDAAACAAQAPPAAGAARRLAFRLCRTRSSRRSDRACRRQPVPPRDDVERPLRVGGGRRVAEVRVARLIAQVRAARRSSRRRARARSRAARRSRTPLEDRAAADPGRPASGRSTAERRSRHRDAGRRVDGQLGRNQQRIARLVRLGVQPFGQRHLEGDARRRRRRRRLRARPAATTRPRAGASAPARRAEHRGHQRKQGHQRKAARDNVTVPSFVHLLFPFVSLSLVPDRLQRDRPRGERQRGSDRPCL